MPNSCSMSIAWPTRDDGATTTISGMPPWRIRSRSAIRAGHSLQVAVILHPLVGIQFGQVVPTLSGNKTTRRPTPPDPWPPQAATMALPPDPPMRMPSSRVTRRAARNESRSVTRTHLSTMSGRTSRARSPHRFPRFCTASVRRPRGSSLRDQRQPLQRCILFLEVLPVPLTVPPVPTPRRNVLSCRRFAARFRARWSDSEFRDWRRCSTGWAESRRVFQAPAGRRRGNSFPVTRVGRP